MPEQPYHSDPESLHTSRRDTLNRCPRSFYIEYVLGLERINDNKQGLRMGDAFAHALELYDTDAIGKVYEKYIVEATEEHTLKALIEEAKVVRVYARLYMETYKQAKEREVMWQLPIPGTHFMNCGTADFLDVDERGWVFGGEDKLKAQWSDNDAKALMLDDQVTGEIYGLIGLGYSPVMGIKYRVTKKRAIKPDYRKGKDKNFAAYLERLESLLRDDMSKVFIDSVETRTHDELKEFEEELLYTAEYIEWMIAREAAGKPTFIKTPKTCGFNGSGCKHPEVCGRYPTWNTLYRRREDRMIVTPTPEQMAVLTAEF